jgi:pimeloyl-ACP methyl ester carboxylesterase
MDLNVNGRRAYAYTGGKPFDPSLPCIVFLHGALNDHSVWTLLARWFAHHGHSVLALDQPGHRRSEGPLLPSVEAVADWTLAVLDAAGVSRASVVGHSMGSLIALEVAARAPERIDHLVMVATAYPMVVSPALLSAAKDTPAAGMAMVNNFSLSTHAAKPGYVCPGSWLHGGGLALMSLVQAGNTQENVFLHDFTLCNAYAHGLEAAAQVACPAHLILGAADQMTPPKATRDLSATLNPRVHTLPGGHALMQEQPDACLASLRLILGPGRVEAGHLPLRAG